MDVAKNVNSIGQGEERLILVAKIEQNRQNLKRTGG